MKYFLFGVPCVYSGIMAALITWIADGEWWHAAVLGAVLSLLFVKWLKAYESYTKF